MEWSDPSSLRVCVQAVPLDSTKGPFSAWSLCKCSSLKSSHSSECFLSIACLEKLQGIKRKSTGFRIRWRHYSILTCHVTLDKLQSLSEPRLLTLFWYIHITCVSCLPSQPKRNLWRLVQNENIGPPCSKSRKKTFFLCSIVSLFPQSVIVFLICYLILHSLGHGDTCQVSTNPQRQPGPHPVTQHEGVRVRHWLFLQVHPGPTSGGGGMSAGESIKGSEERQAVGPHMGQGFKPPAPTLLSH